MIPYVYVSTFRIILEVILDLFIYYVVRTIPSRFEHLHVILERKALLKAMTS